MNNNTRKDIDSYSEAGYGFVYRPNSMQRVKAVNELNRLQQELEEIKKEAAKLE